MDEILSIHTLGHHWRILSAADLKRYFRFLSPDFEVLRTEYFDHPHQYNGIARRVLATLAQPLPFLRETLYLEVQVREKVAGIVIVPHWG